MAAETQYANRIGLGVVVDDPNEAALRHLREVRSELRVILELSQSMAGVRLPGERPTRTRTPRQEAQESVAARTEQVREESRQLSLLDRVDEETQRRRETRRRGSLARSLAYEEEWTRRREEQIRRLSDAELSTRAAAGGGRDAALEAEIARRRQLSREFVPRTGPITEAERIQAQARLLPQEQRGITFGRSPLTPLDAGETERAERQFGKWRDQWMKGQQRRAYFSQLDFESKANAPAGSLREEFTPTHRGAIFGPQEDALLRARRLEQERRRDSELRALARGQQPVLGPEENATRRQIRLSAAQREAAGLPYGPTRADMLNVGQAEGKLNRASDAAHRLRTEAEKISVRRAGTQIGEDASRLSSHLASAQTSARALREELQRPVSIRRTREEIEGDLGRVQTRIRGVEGEMRRLREQEQNAPAAPQLPGGGGGGGNDYNSAGSVVQRIVRNMAIRAAIFYTLYDLKRFTTDSIEAARVSAETERQLESTARQSGVTLRSALSIGESIRNNADLSRQEAQGVAANVLTFNRRAGGRGDTAAFSRAVTDLAAARGIENKNLAQAVERLSRGEGVEELLGRNPEALLKQYAQRQIESRPQIPDNLIVGKERPQFRAMSQQVQEYVSRLTEAERAQIIWNETLRAGNDVMGEAARRHATLEGRLDAASARWADAHVAVGNFVLGLKPLNELLGYISDKLNGMDTSKLEKLGAGGQITPQDVAGYTTARTNQASTQFSSWLTGHGNALEAAGVVAVGLKVGSKLMDTSFKELAGRILSAGGGVVGAIAGVGVVVALVTGRIRENAEQNLARAEAQAVAEGARVGQINAAAKAGTLRYYVPGATGPQGVNEAEFFRRYTPEQRLQLFRDNRVQQTIAPAGPTQNEQDLAARANRVGLPGVTDEGKIEAAERQIDDFWDRVNQKEEEERKKLEAVQNTALARLRETVQGSFRIVEEVGQQSVDRDNPFVKIFTDGATAAQRMRQEWGYLGQSTARYFTQLEEGSILIRLTESRFQSLARAQEFVNRAEAEADERRLSPELTREEQAVGRLTQALIRQAQELPQLQAQYRLVFQGVVPTGLDREQALRYQVENFERIRRVGAGLDTQGQREVNRLVNEAVLGATRGLSPAQINNFPWLREAYRTANLGQQAELGAQIGDELARIQILSRERRRIIEDVRQSGELQRREERDVTARARLEGRTTLTAQERRRISRAGDLADEALIRLTDKLSPREQGAELFAARNEAIRRQAEREFQHEAEALAAAEAALEVQRSLLEEVKSLRAAVLSGSYSVSVQVANDTQARVDQQDLEDANQGAPVVLRSDTNRTSPYSGSFAKYGRGGAPR